MLSMTLIFIFISLNFLMSPGYCSAETCNTSCTQTNEIFSTFDDLVEDFMTSSNDIGISFTLDSHVPFTSTVLSDLLIPITPTLLFPHSSDIAQSMLPSDIISFTSFVDTVSSSYIVLSTTTNDAINILTSSSIYPLSFDPSTHSMIEGTILSSDHFSSSSQSITTIESASTSIISSSIGLLVSSRVTEETSTFSLLLSATSSLPSSSSLLVEPSSSPLLVGPSSSPLLVGPSSSDYFSSSSQNITTIESTSTSIISSSIGLLVSSRVTEETSTLSLLLSATSSLPSSSPLLVGPSSSDYFPSSSQNITTIESTSTSIISSSIGLLVSSRVTEETSTFSLLLSATSLLPSSSPLLVGPSSFETMLISSQSILPSPSQVHVSSHSGSSVLLTTVSPLLSPLSSRTVLPSYFTIHSIVPSTSNVVFTLSSINTYHTTIVTILPSVTPITIVPVLDPIELINATTVLISWSFVPDAIGYIIFVQEQKIIQKRETSMMIRIEASKTSHTLRDLRPYTNYSIQVASIGPDNVTRDASSSVIIVTPEAIPNPPVNATWQDIGNGLINVSWSPPTLPNGIITMYIITVTITSSRSQFQYNISGSSYSLIIGSDAQDVYIIKVVAVNGAGTSSPQNAIMIPSNVGTSPPSNNGGLSGGSVAAIVIVCLFVVIVIVIVVVLLLFLAWRRWMADGGIDDNIGEMEYKTGDTRSNDASIDFDETGGSQTQLTAKRWMRANANYSTPSSLLPSIADLVSRYSTAEDVVTKSNDFSHVNGLGTISEAPKESDNLTSERPYEVPVTLSSIYNKSDTNASQTDAAQNEASLPFDPHSFSEREAGMRESEIADGNHPLFEMMENVYLPSEFDFETLKQYHLDPSLIEIKEQVGVGEHCKVMIGVPEMLPFEKNEEVVVVKVLKDDAFKDGLLCAAHILSQFTHHNILNLLAITVTPPMVLLPYLELGDLKKYLVRVRRRTRLEYQPCNFSINDQLNISSQVACGMEYLSTKFYIHRALQSKYILLDEDFNVKISGFEMSLTLGNASRYEELKQTDKLPVKWLSLETLICGRFTPYTDIWSFGVVLWEIFSYGLTPYRGLPNGEVLQHIKDGERLNKPSECPQDIYTLMLHCWNERCRERPSFSELYQHLTGIMEATRTSQGTTTTDNEFLSILNPVDASSVSVEATTAQADLNPAVIVNEGIQDSTIELEMTEVVLRNREGSAAANDDPGRHSNRSSVPELVLSTQARPDSNQSDIELPNQLASTEEFTVL